MNNFLGQLNLTTQERRIVVAIFLVVVVVLNLLFVWPHFGEWGRLKKQLADLYDTEAKYNRAIQLDTNPTNGWKKQVDKLARQQGGSKIDSPVDPQNQLQQTIYQQERKTGVTVGSFSPGTVKTNEYFEEHSTTISFESPEQQLISFLFGMGNDPAMIRVAKLSLQPVEPHRYHLKGSITLTANYTKKDITPTAAPANQKPNFGPKPPAVAAKKPGTAPDPAQGIKHRSGVPPPGPGQNGQSANNSKTNPGSRKNPLSKLVPNGQNQ
jgi:Tfp pilus assembly protein PilO